MARRLSDHCPVIMVMHGKQVAGVAKTQNQLTQNLFCAASSIVRHIFPKQNRKHHKKPKTTKISKPKTKRISSRRYLKTNSQIRPINHLSRISGECNSALHSPAFYHGHAGAKNSAKNAKKIASMQKSLQSAVREFCGKSICRSVFCEKIHTICTICPAWYWSNFLKKLPEIPK